MDTDELGQPLLPGEGTDAVRRAGLALAAVAFSGLVSLMVCISMIRPLAMQPEKLVGQKQYTRLVAEGVRYRVFEQMGIDRLSFSSCRVEKKRSGGISFGAFNVLVVDGLVLNLQAVSGVEGGADARVKTEDVSAVRGFAEALLLSQGMGAVRFSGVRINGLLINRTYSNRVERLLTAARAESGMKVSELKMRECAVTRSGGQETHVKEARLVLRPRPALVYLSQGKERRFEL